MRRVMLLALLALALPTLFAVAFPTAASANSVGFNISVFGGGDASFGFGSLDAEVDGDNGLVITGGGGLECPIPTNILHSTSTCTISGGSVELSSLLQGHPEVPLFEAALGTGSASLVTRFCGSSGGVDCIDASFSLTDSLIPNPTAGFTGGRLTMSGSGEGVGSWPPSFGLALDIGNATLKVTPVPEPGTLSLFGLGLLLGSALLARKKKLLNGAQA